MSWDIFAVNVPLVFESIEEIPPDFKPKPLGNRSAVIARIKRIVPTANFSDPSSGLIEKDGWSIELNMGDDEICEDFAFHVRGDGDEAVEVVARILDGLGIRLQSSSRQTLCGRSKRNRELQRVARVPRQGTALKVTDLSGRAVYCAAVT